MPTECLRQARHQKDPRTPKCGQQRYASQQTGNLPEDPAIAPLCNLQSAEYTNNAYFFITEGYL